MKQTAVYILASKLRGILYKGFRSDLIKRIWEHKNAMVDGFTKKYNDNYLVYSELHEDIELVILWEK
ncbi:GIY-YIG nuclease family protein [Thermodesulfobacteriota bacterium]